MLMRAEVIPEVEEELGREGFSDPLHQKVAREIKALFKAGKKVNVQDLLCQVGDEEVKDFISELLLQEERVIDADRMLRDCLRKVKLSRVRQEIQHVDEEIRQRSQQEKGGPAGASGLKELLKRKQRLIVEQKKWVDDSAVRHESNAGQ
jgi:replicative DNA helicase